MIAADQIAHFACAHDPPIASKPARVKVSSTSRALARKGPQHDYLSGRKNATMEERADIPTIREYLENLRRKLMRADSVPLPAPGTEKKAAAVLVPLFERGGDLHVLYTRRSDRLVSHRGQVAFPGGRFDRGDPHLLAAALRETYEEVGIAPTSVEVLGSFRGFRTYSTDMHVTPFVGLVHGSPELRADPKEVAEIFDVPLEALHDSRYRGHCNWRFNGHAIQQPAILYNGQIIWGLTYSLTLSLLKLGGAVVRY
jgi:8-oxo-dGTP pyrophosphatase MutT (NUDIX family)